MTNTVTGAQDVATSQEQGTRSIQSRGWTKQDTSWVISLFGTAVGAGILFLPINAGMGGFWPLVVMALLVVVSNTLFDTEPLVVIVTLALVIVALFVLTFVELPPTKV